MKRVNLLRLFSGRWLVTLPLGAAFALTLAGCPGGADLEHPERYPIGTGTSAGGTGGSGATGGTGGMTGNRMVPASVDCDYATALTKTCAISACHKASAVPAAAGLVLVPDSGLVDRLYGVPATHGDIYCADISDTCPTPPTTCPKGDLLIDPTDVTKSWILLKMNNPPDCGDAMPAGVTITADQKACIEKLVTEVAKLP
jgi:hypothetical protein